MSAREIITSLPKGTWNGRSGTACCPAHDDTNPSFVASDADEGTILLYCYAGCTFEEMTEALRRRGLWPDRNEYSSQIGGQPDLRVVRDQTAQHIALPNYKAFAREIWEQSEPINNTLGEVYLRNRGISISLPSSLRFHPSLKHNPTGLLLPTMIGAVQDKDGEIVGVHRTYLTEDGGSKASVSPNKMMLGQCTGGAVRLAEATTSIGIAEGIETALSVAQMYSPMPVWAALTVNNLGHMHLPPDLGELFLFLDGDPSDSQAASAAAQAIWALQRREQNVRIVRPPEGMDFNDLLLDEAGDD